MQAMEVVGIRVERTMNAPVLVLRDRRDGDLLPIWIGAHEADAITAGLEGRMLPRPMTHDTVISLLEAAEGACLVGVEIIDVHEGLFTAEIVLSNGARVDARPSDAVALALRAAVPIRAAKRVLNRAGVYSGKRPPHVDIDAFRHFLEQVSAEDFG